MRINSSYNTQKMIPKNQEVKKDIPYVNERDFVHSDYNPQLNQDRIASNEHLWYNTIIKPSIKNKSRLISQNVDRAITVFSRFDDVQGLEIIAGNVRFPKSYRNAANMQLESINASKKYPASPKTYFPIISGKQEHPGRDAFSVDFSYHGEGYKG